MTAAPKAPVSEDYKRGWQDCAKAMTSMSQVIPLITQTQDKLDHAQRSLDALMKFAHEKQATFDSLNASLSALHDTFKIMEPGT